MPATRVQGHARGNPSHWDPGIPTCRGSFRSSREPGPGTLHRHAAPHTRLALGPRQVAASHVRPSVSFPRAGTGPGRGRTAESVAWWVVACWELAYAGGLCAGGLRVLGARVWSRVCRAVRAARAGEPGDTVRLCAGAARLCALGVGVCLRLPPSLLSGTFPSRARLPRALPPPSQGSRWVPRGRARGALASRSSPKCRLRLPAPSSSSSSSPPPSPSPSLPPAAMPGGGTCQSPAVPLLLLAQGAAPPGSQVFGSQETQRPEERGAEDPADPLRSHGESRREGLVKQGGSRVLSQGRDKVRRWRGVPLGKEAAGGLQARG